MAPKKPDPNLSAGEFYEPYVQYARTLRTWFVAYGIGGPALIATHPDILRKLSESDWVGRVGWLFLIGAGSQIVLACLNKAAMWYLYRGEDDNASQEKWQYRVADCFTEHYWIEVLADLVTLLCFGASTIMVFLAVTRVASASGG